MKVTFLFFKAIKKYIKTWSQLQRNLPLSTMNDKVAEIPKVCQDAKRAGNRGNIYSDVTLWRLIIRVTSPDDTDPIRILWMEKLFLCQGMFFIFAGWSSLKNGLFHGDNDLRYPFLLNSWSKWWFISPLLIDSIHWIDAIPIKSTDTVRIKLRNEEICRKRELSVCMRRIRKNMPVSCLNASSAEILF